METPTKPDAQTQRQNNIEKFLKVGSIIVGVFLISVIAIVKINNPNFKVWWVVGLVAFIITLTLVMFFLFAILRKFKGDEKDPNKYPEPITFEQAKEIIKEQLITPEYADEFRGFSQHKFYNAGRDGKSRILVVQLEPTAYEKNPYRFYCLNLHYPREMWSLVSQQKYNPNEILRTVNALSLAPEVEPDIERTKVENVLTGTTVETEKKTHKSEEKKKEEKPKEDLA
jgi:uncharacterized membrane protein